MKKIEMDNSCMTVQRNDGFGISAFFRQRKKDTIRSVPIHIRVPSFSTNRYFLSGCKKINLAPLSFCEGGKNKSVHFFVPSFILNNGKNAAGRQYQGNFARKGDREFESVLYLILTFLITACVLFQNSFGVTKACAGETQKYLGQILSEGNPPGYGSWGGSCLSVDFVGPTNCFFSITGGEFTAQNGNKLSVVWLKSNTNTHDTKGHIIWRAEDTLEFPFDHKATLGDIDICSSTLYPNAYVIAVGREWISRIKPKVGGYIHPIEKAWRVDISTRKFVEISTSGVSCELNEDRD